jgi:hypothetical protein
MHMDDELEKNEEDELGIKDPAVLDEDDDIDLGLDDEEEEEDEDELDPLKLRDQGFGIEDDDELV